MVGASNSAIVMDGINVTVPTDAADDEEDIWDVKSISQEDFQNIASLGFNAIRLHMNYIMFEDDGNPGVYKEDGWHWLDRCIALAKDAGLYLLLDMHAPQGGYQSDKPQGFTAFWDGSGALPNTSNQDRLIDLWGAIANRYKHEPTVLGYDLINEPRPNTSEEWYLFAEQIIAEIRTYDNNHLIVVEVPLIPNYTIREVNDNKVMYDSHFYYTWGYATQFSAAYGNSGDEWGKYDPENPIYINSSGNVVAQGTPGAVAFDDAYLESILLEDILDFTTSNDVPTNVGEFGIVWEAYSQNVGAMQYMRDLYKLLDGENSKNTPVSRFYFSYQGNTFGLYTNWNGFQTNQTEVTGNQKDFFANNYTWTGETGTDWSTTGNWSTDLSPEPANNVIVPVIANQPHITATPASPAICNNLTINTGAELTVDAGKAITVSGTLANAGNLLVKSTATGTGSVFHSTPNIEAQIERYIAGWSDNEHGWHFLSAPVAGQVISAFHDYTAANDFYKWDEVGGEWINRKDAYGNLNPAFETEFAIGRGYLIAKQANETPVFEGLVNVSNVSVSGLTNTSVNSTSGWHLLGNPFACALLWNQTNGEWNLLNVAANCQFWDESSASYQVTEPDDIIPAANGFMVYTNGNGSLTIPASARTHSAIDWFKNDKSENRIVLTATDLTGNTSQKTIIRFHPEASESYDLNFDSYFLSGFAPLFYSKSQDENYALNSLPSFNENMKIQLGFTKNINQNFSIGVSEKMENIQLFLIDKKLTVEHLLQPGSPYFFNSEPGDDAERFELTMKTTGMNEGNTNETLEVYFSNGELHFIGNQKKVFVEISDLLGRIEAVYEIQSGEYQKVPIALPSGVYIVRAFNSFSNNSLKIIIP
jgi:aryl-phospho-beta-D-glucosidase BglC (GH1 family)